MNLLLDPCTELLKEKAPRHDPLCFEVLCLNSRLLSSHINLNYACQAVSLSVLSDFRGRPRAHQGSGRKGQTRRSRLYRSWWNPIVREPGVDPGTSFRSHAMHLRSQRSLVRAPHLVFYLDAYPSIIPNTRKKVLCSTHSPHCSIPLPERVTARILQYAEQTFY